MVAARTQPTGGTAAVAEVAHRARAGHALGDAEQFYAARLAGSWV